MMESSKRKRLNHKKYQKRTAAIVTLLCYATFLTAVEQRSKQSQGPLTGLEFSQTGATIHRPFAPHIKVLSAAEIQVSWLPVTSNNGIGISRYELYQGEELEYSGHDLEHIAKRLRPSTIYSFKLRACGASPGSCSEFSIARFAKTDIKPHYGEGSALTASYLGKRCIFVTMLPGIVFVLCVTGLCLTIIYMYRYICTYFSFCSVMDVELGVSGNIITKYQPIKSKYEMSKTKDSNLDDDQRNKVEAEAQTEITLVKESDVIEIAALENNEKHQRSNSRAEVSFADEKQQQRSPGLRRKRGRSMRKNRNSDSETGVGLPLEPNESGIALQRCRHNSNGDKTLECVVLIDNSNIFIGAREAACAKYPKLRPKHVKMRLQGLVNALERGRTVRKAFAGCSSPPGTDHVWETYKRLGYIVDLEERRGKDEQRVDELLHLEIYKAIIDLSPRTLVLATGDGSKGKSKTGSSFISCALAAIEHGWQVELHSWRHSLSSEWLKIEKKFDEGKLAISYLDEYLDDIIQIDRTFVAHSNNPTIDYNQLNSREQ